MLFKQIILSALVVGAIAGGVLGLGQYFTTSPLIYAAEAYEGGTMPGEKAAAKDAESAGHADAHDHGEAVWEPPNRSARIAYTFLADFFTAIGFGTLLLIAMYLARRGGSTIGPKQGVLWGLAGFVAVFGAPALGLSPELPGSSAAALESRQLWWIATVLVTAAGLGLLAFAPGWKKLAGLVLLPIPHLFGAPQADGPMFSHPNPAAVEQLQALHSQFIVATTAVNALFWVVLGVACGWAMRHWVLREAATGSPEPVHG